MKYLYDTKIEYISQTEAGDRFIVTIFDDDKKSVKTLMDDTGRIYDLLYQDISERMFDEFFNARIDTYNYAVIDKNGREIIRHSFKDEVHSFHDGIAVFESSENKRNYFLTETGEFLGQEFENVECFYNGTGSVQLLNGKYVLVDKDMKIVSPQFDYIVPFINKKYTWATINGRTCIIDKNFTVVSNSYIDNDGKSQPYSTIFDIDDNDIIIHQRRDETGKTRYAFVSVDGKQLGEEHSMVSGFVEGICRVFDEGKRTRFVDTQGHYITPRDFINCSNFKNGFAVVGDFDANGEFIFAYLKKDGTLVKFEIPKTKSASGYDGTWFSFASDFSDGTGLVMFDGNKRYPVTADGKVLKGSMLLEPYHSEIASYQTRSKKHSFIRKNGEEFGLEFDAIGIFRGNFAVVKNQGEYDAVSTSGILLSIISKIAEEIENNPKYILMLEKKVFKDRKLVLSLLEIAEKTAIAQQNSDYLTAQSRIRKNIESQIEDSVASKKKLGE